MKVHSIDGKQVGKLGGRVYYVNHGVQISREYNPEPTNPNTAAQVNQRSRFKLASQISAALEPVIAFPRKGLLSPRNQFVKVNMPYFYADLDGASVTYENLQIARGTGGLPGLRLMRLAGAIFTCSLQEKPGSNIDAVVYGFFSKTTEGSFQYIKSVTITEPTQNGNFPTQQSFVDFPVNSDVIALAYGVKLRDAKAKATFANYQIKTGEDIAKLLATRKLDMSQIGFTETRGNTLYSGQQNSAAPSTGQAMLYLTSLNGGKIGWNVDGGEQQIVTNFRTAIDLGETIVLTAIPDSSDIVLKGWYDNGTQQYFSQSTTIEFQLTEMRDILAVWEYAGGLE